MKKNRSLETLAFQDMIVVSKYTHGFSDTFTLLLMFGFGGMERIVVRIR